MPLKFYKTRIVPLPLSFPSISFLFFFCFLPSFSCLLPSSLLSSLLGGVRAKEAAARCSSSSSSFSIYPQLGGRWHGSPWMQRGGAYLCCTPTCRRGSCTLPWAPTSSAPGAASPSLASMGQVRPPSPQKTPTARERRKGEKRGKREENRTITDTWVL